LKEVKARVMMAKTPEKVVELAIKGMLPHNSLGRAMFRKLKVYKGVEHEHQAQKPEILEINV
jgi:large subunit ribosomal protein L13